MPRSQGRRGRRLLPRPGRWCVPALAVLAGVTMASESRGQDGPGKGYAAIPDGAFSVVAEIRAKPGNAAELRAVTLPLIELVRGDPKNLAYFLQEDRASTGYFIFYEVFASEADFEAHNAQPYVQAWFAKLPDLALGDIQAMKMKILAGPAK